MSVGAFAKVIRSQGLRPNEGFNQTVYSNFEQTIRTISPRLLLGDRAW